eukprot:scaffold103655_cov19-Prasinocladus_malaysianus.AAC.1
MSWDTRTPTIALMAAPDFSSSPQMPYSGLVISAGSTLYSAAVDTALVCRVSCSHGILMIPFTSSASQYSYREGGLSTACR